MSRIMPLKNGFCGIDYDDILTVPARYKTIRIGGNLLKEKTIKIKVEPEKKYVRLVALKDFVVKSKLVEKNEKGAYIELKNGICFLSLGKNSWIEGSFMATELHPTLIGVNCEIGDNTLIGKNCKIGKHTQIMNNCNIGSSCRIEKNCLIEDNVAIKDTMVGENTFIGKNSTLGMKTLDGQLALAGGTTFVGVTPNHYNYFWWERSIKPHNFGREKLTLRDAWERYAKDKYYKKLITYISENVQVDLGTQIFAGATIGKNTKIGCGVEVNPKTVVKASQIIQDKEIVK